jgi:hypothetical protein
MRHPRVIIAGLGLALPIAGSPARHRPGRLSRRQSRLLTRPAPAAMLTTTATSELHKAALASSSRLAGCQDTRHPGSSTGGWPR